MEAELRWPCRTIAVSKGQLYAEFAPSLGFPEPIFWRLMNKRKPYGTNCTLIESDPF